MFSSVDKIDKIMYSIYYPLKDGIVYQTKDHDKHILKYVKNNSSEFDFILERYVSQITTFRDSLIIIYDNCDFDELTLSFEKRVHKKKSNIELNLFSDSTNHFNEYFICHSGNIKNQQAGIYDLLNDSVLFLKRNFFPWKFIGAELFGKTNEKIISYHYLNGDVKWQFDATDLGRYRHNSQSPEKEGKVEKIIGVYQDLLIVAITNSTILAIDIHTGELKGKWRDLPEGQSYGKMKRTTLVYPFQSFIDQSAGKLIGLIGSYYWEIDLHGDTIYFHDATEEFKKHQVGTHTSGQITPQGDHIMFASEFFSPANERIQKVAAFNRKTKLIDWSFEDLAPTVMPKAPVVEGNRMYVLDTGGTLHVFEKEQSA